MRVDWCVSSWFRIKNTHSPKPPSETRDRTHPYTGEMADCASPPLALTAQDSVPRITATHSGGHCARRGCEAKIGVLGGNNNNNNRKRKRKRKRKIKEKEKKNIEKT